MYKKNNVFNYNKYSKFNRKKIKTEGWRGNRRERKWMILIECALVQIKVCCILIYLITKVYLRFDLNIYSANVITFVEYLIYKL